jgi:hypothetical protein
MKKHSLVPALISLMFPIVAARFPFAQALAAPSGSAPQLAIIDTDIGDDIDDAFALALALRSPELKILGVTTAFGDTELRARLVDRYLAAVGRKDIPVAAGVATKATNVFTQAAYARQEPERKHPDASLFCSTRFGNIPARSRSSPLVRRATWLRQSNAMRRPFAR